MWLVTMHYINATGLQPVRVSRTGVDAWSVLSIHGVLADVRQLLPTGFVEEKGVSADADTLDDFCFPHLDAVV